MITVTIVSKRIKCGLNNEVGIKVCSKCLDRFLRILD